MADIKTKGWHMKAKFGDTEAMCKLGHAYRDGDGVEKDLAESANWFYKAATAGNVNATFEMAVAFYQGLGVNANANEGFKWMTLAAELGHVKAMADVGWKYYNGNIVETNFKKSLFWLEKAAEAGDISSIKYLAGAYAIGVFGYIGMNYVEKDEAKAAQWYQKAAEAGDAESIYKLGVAYQNGKGVEQDFAKAAELYEKSANIGVALAKTRLAILYKSGKGVEQDYVKAVQLLEEATQAGERNAMYHLGRLYAEGQGVKQDFAGAMGWYLKAAEAGDSSAMYALGEAYDKGDSIQKDSVKAAEWYKKAAEANVVEAMVRFADMLRDGEGVGRNLEEAVAWYCRGADAGNTTAMLRLGCAYQDGTGVAKDLDLAEAWLSKAIQHGQEKAYIFLAKNKLIKGRGPKVAREAMELLHMAEGQANCKDYKELLSKAQRLLSYEEHFRQIMFDKFGVEIPEEAPIPQSAIDELEQMIGLRKVKEEVRKLKSFVEVQKKMEEMGKEAQKMSMHMVFTGNPGTGKTTVARIIAKIFYEIGIIPTDKFVECDRDRLVSEYKNATTNKTKEVIQEALGGVLFVDEAYTLSQGGPEDYGQEAIDAILKAMEDNRDNLIVIAAGYEDEMRKFVNSNPGFPSRFKLFLDFEDYTVSDMVQIFKYNCDSKGYIISDDAWGAVVSELNQISRNKSKSFANAREVRNFFEKVLTKQNVRISSKDISSLSEIEFITFIKEDIAEQEEIRSQGQGSALAELEKLIGLGSVKEEVIALKKKVAAQKKLRDMGRNVEGTSLHMVFTGNPGTGKTTVARIIAQVFYEIGIIPSNKLVECKRADLVAEYIGQTAPKTQEVIEKALGGVLFIDEAYALSNSGAINDFGPEAIDTILVAMENNRDNLIVIVAGYKEEMQDFLASNSGLESRFKYFIDFPDYTPDEMFEMFKVFCNKEQYAISEDAVPYLKEHFIRMDAEKGEKFGNGRDVRNYYERVTQKVLIRFSELEDDATEEDLIIRVEDVIGN